MARKRDLPRRRDASPAPEMRMGSEDDDVMVERRDWLIEWMVIIDNNREKEVRPESK